jgi:hypothetical protein
MEKWQEMQTSSFLWSLIAAMSWQEMHSLLALTPECCGMSGRLEAIGPTRLCPQPAVASESANRTGKSFFILAIPPATGCF